MNRRAGVTLVEVLVAIFVMAIGMLALLTMFPIGAMSMAQAIRDDRCGAAAAASGCTANALDIRTDPNVTAETQAATPKAVYVDPMAFVSTTTPANLSTNIKRVDLSSNRAGMTGYPYRMFAMMDDLTFGIDGKPLGGSTSLERAGRYSWAYLLKPDATDSTQVHYWVVIYYGRSTSLTTWEQSCTASGTSGSTELTLTGTGSPPPVRRGTWVFDANTVSFYRIVSSTVSGNTATVEVDPPLNGTPSSTLLVMENVAEVFYKGKLR